LPDQVGVRGINSDRSVLRADVSEWHGAKQFTLAGLLRQAVLDAFGNRLALKLCHRPKNVAVHPAGRCAGIDPFLNRDDLYSLFLEPVAQVQHVAQVPGQPVELPEHDTVEGLRLSGGEQLRQRQPSALRRSADTSIDVHVDQRPTMCLAVGVN